MGHGCLLYHEMQKTSGLRHIIPIDSHSLFVRLSAHTNKEYKKMD